MKKIEIIPAIMPATLGDMRQRVARVRGRLPFVQIDIMDGIFVPEKTWPYTQKGDTATLSPDFIAITEESEGLPFWEDVNYEIDLMVAKPSEIADYWISAGASRLIFHIESFATSNAPIDTSHGRFSSSSFGIFLDILRQRFPTASDLEIGLALNTNTSLEEVIPYVGKIDFIQCMGIAEIGYQGQPFDQKVLDHVSALRTRFPELIISIDGAVSVETAPQLVEAGATRLVSGSALFNSLDIGEAIDELESATEVL